MLLSILKQTSLGRIGSDLSVWTGASRLHPHQELHTFGIVGVKAVIFMKRRARVVELHLNVCHIQTKCFGASKRSWKHRSCWAHTAEDDLFQDHVAVGISNISFWSPSGFPKTVPSYLSHILPIWTGRPRNWIRMFLSRFCCHYSKVFYIPGGAGFLNHQEYVDPRHPNNLLNMCFRNILIFWGSTFLLSRGWMPRLWMAIS